MRHHVISIARSTQRRKAVEKVFASRGLEFEWFDAIDWKTLTPEQMALVDHDSRVRWGKRALQLGEIGCALSHRQVMARVAQSEDRVAAVFEDDIGLTEDAARVLDLLESTEIGFDVVFLHRIYSEDRFVPVRRLSSAHDLGIVRHKDNGAQGYVITRDAARRYLQLHPSVSQPVDVEMHSYWKHGLTTYTLNPPIITIRFDPSESIRLESPTPERRYTPMILLRKAYSQIRDAGVRRIVFHRRIRREREPRA